MLVVNSQASACNEMSLVTQSGALGARSGSLCACEKTRFAISDWLSMWHVGFGPVTNQSKEKPNDSIAFRGRYWQPSLSRVIWWYFRTDILFSRLISRQKTSTMTKNSILQLRSWKPGRLEWTIRDEIYQFCSLSSDFRAMFVLKWRTSVTCTKYR